MPITGAAVCNRAAVVHHVAGGHALTLVRLRVEAHEGFAGVHTDADLDLLVLLVHPVPDRERGADRTLGVVLVRDGRSEEADHGVADNFCTGPPNRSSSALRRP
jgi:hypothetical protein